MSHLSVDKCLLTNPQRTPAWNPTATSSSYSQDPFSATGGRTPAYEPSYNSSRTPGYTGPSNGSYDQYNNANNHNPNTNRPYDAPTPGKDFTTAPTPTPHPTNGYGNPGGTPATIGGAPTPKFSGDAPTPFGGQPETPGWGGQAEDDGPRYED